MFIYVVLLATVAVTAALPPSRIVNGNPAERHGWPSKASLLYDGRHTCGATLLRKDVALTAAHCVERDVSLYKLVVGEHQLTTTSQVQQTLQVKNFKIHEDWDANSIINDIALVYLDTPAILNENVNLTNLLQSEDAYDKSKCIIAGWGLTQGGGTVSDILQEANVTVLSHQRCRNELGFWLSMYYREKEHMCFYGIGDQSKRGSACNGDSGGGAWCDDKNGNWVQVGITSWGKSGCPEGDVSVYTRLSTYIDWINENLQTE